jgi:sporulation protein YlmC with PRC-barrel domain
MRVFSSAVVSGTRTSPLFFKAAIGLCCLLGVFGTTPPRIAQGQAIDILETRGYRMSQLIGKPVFNKRNDRIGKLDEILLTVGGEVIFVVQIGPYIGVQNRLVLFPRIRIDIEEGTGKITASMASKDELKKMAAFFYP